MYPAPHCDHPCESSFKYVVTTDGNEGMACYSGAAPELPGKSVLEDVSGCAETLNLDLLECTVKSLYDSSSVRFRLFLPRGVKINK